MLRRWFAIAALATTVIAVGAQTASASSTQVSRFKTIDAPYAKADATWTTALERLTAKSTVADLSKPSLAFVPTMKTFDTALGKIGFSGKTGTDVATVIKLNGELIADIDSIKSVTGFVAEFSALSPKYFAVQTSLAKDLGIAAAYVQV